MSENQLSSDSDFSDDSEPFDLEGDNNSNGEDEWKNVPNLVLLLKQFSLFQNYLVHL